ncbi:MAG: hypothetical protein AB1899_10075 [Pseudomonadota bacterium]
MRLGAWLLGLWALSAQAATPVDLASGGPGTFIHLDASGRQALALSGEWVALAWEDNRSGAPRCHLAVARGGGPFQTHGFGRGECFEPAVAPLADGRFLLIWEDEAGVAAALVDEQGPGPLLALAPAGGQGSVAWHPGQGALAAWSAPDGRWRRVWLAPLAVDGRNLAAGPVRPVDPVPPVDDQTYPVLAAAAPGPALVWEDRRAGHTVIFYSRRGASGDWTPPRRLSGNPTGKAQGDLGRGTGAMRPALAAFADRLAGVWLDKRDFLSGYDVYAALDRPDGSFAKDGKAQDSFGDAIAQWHPAAAGNGRGELVIAFDDERDGTTDIWLARLTPAGWGENFTLPALSGPGRQSDPALALDEAGHLHLAWLDQDGEGRVRLRYLRQPAPTGQ